MRVMAGLLPQTSVLICILGTFTVTVISQALIEGRCSFVKTLAVKYGRSLDGHVIASYPVEKEDDCQLKCFRHRLCVSYNLGPVVEDDVRDCEISKSDEFRDPQNMTDRPGYFYRGIQNSCSSGPCPRNATCIPNFESDSFQCECPAGFTGETCAIDVDECGQQTDDCHLNASCKNTKGSFECWCNQGFQGNGRLCKDVNECETNLHNCLHPNGTCINSVGSYNCSCKSGFQGDGINNCTDIEECDTNQHNCHSNGTCRNTMGSFNCSCKPGYRGDGAINCTDVDECTEQTHNCSENAQCNNNAGSFDCLCNVGYFGNGHVCEVSVTPSACETPLGLESGAITDGQISASSEFDASVAASHGRLNHQGSSHEGAWAAARDDVDHWLQVDLETQYTRVTRVATQGRNSSAVSQWVTIYQLQFSDDGVTFKYYKERGQTDSKNFSGNTDRETVVYHYLNPPVRARYIRFRPTAWHSWISMRVELYGCRDCQNALGMESGAIPDEQISASSIYDENHAAHQSRLSFQASEGIYGAWSARTADANQWLQIDLGSEHTVTRVGTQGRTDRAQWVTKYSLQYSIRGEELQYYGVEEVQGQRVINEFAGNTDQNTAAYHYLNPPIRTRFIRFRPTAWNSWISMRVELYGCRDIDECVTGEHRCHLNASCTNIIGCYTCTCNLPYYGNGFHCQDPVPPTFQSVPVSNTVEEQQNVTFICLANGFPKPVITWSKVGGTLPVEAAVNQGNLFLLEVVPENSGNYTCTATSEVGNITSPAVKLLVHSLLQFTVLPPLGPIYIFTGDSLTLPCSADSDLKPTLGWRMKYSRGIEIFPDNTLFIASANLSHTGSYSCTANNSFRTLEESITLYVYALPSCRDIKSRQVNSSGQPKRDTSGHYFIDPDGDGVGEEPFEVYCNMTMYGDNAVTVISHDSEAKTLVDGHERAGSYQKDVTYTGASLTQIANLVTISAECRQFIKFECFEAALLKGTKGWWVSRDGSKMNYWGGAAPDSGSCACARDLSCVNPNFHCNCDSEKSEWLEDSGFLSDKSTLPVSQLRFGDTGAQTEKGYHTLGKLMCIGEAIHVPPPVTPASAEATLQIPTPTSTETIPVVSTFVSTESIMPTVLAVSLSTDDTLQTTTSMSTEAQLLVTLSVSTDSTTSTITASATSNVLPTVTASTSSVVAE